VSKGWRTALQISIGAALAWDNDLCEVTIISGGEDTYLVTGIRGRRRTGRPARVGAADAAPTADAEMAAVSELCGRLGVVGAIDVPGRLICHGRQLILRLPPRYSLLPEILARLRALPAMP
jgi:hypothetical protein